MRLFHAELPLPLIELALHRSYNKTKQDPVGDYFGSNAKPASVAEALAQKASSA